jgi:hypothetical protein
MYTVLFNSKDDRPLNRSFTVVQYGQNYIYLKARILDYTMAKMIDTFILVSINPPPPLIRSTLVSAGAKMLHPLIARIHW